MIKVPSYTKVLTLGARGTERALVGPVVVQEKVRGLAEWYKAQLFTRQLLFGEAADANTTD